MKKTEINLKIGELEKALEGLEKPSLNHIKKEQIKINLISQINVPAQDRLPLSLHAFVNVIRRSVAQFALDPITRVRLKERIFAMIDEHSQKTFFWLTFMGFHKKLVSSTLVIALLFGLFSFFNVETAIVRAANFTALSDYSGGLLIERNGEFVEPEKGMKIFENDQIITGEDGEAVIEYFDYSTTRLAPSTHLVVNKLDQLDSYSARSYVEVSVVSGVVWSRVINLVEGNSFFVVEALNTYASAKKAAFNVEVLGSDEVEIEVFKHVVDVKTDGEVEKVVSGKKVNIGNGESIVKKIERLSLDDEHNEWVQGNLENDKNYVSEVEDKLLAARMDAVGIEVSDDISFENSLRENAVVFLTFDDVKRTKKELELAEKKFIAAQISLNDENIGEDKKVEAENAIYEFAQEVKDFYIFIDEIAVTDPEYADELKGFVEEKIILNKKDLCLAFPGSPDYETKQIIEELELLAAKDVSSIATIKSDQAVEKLAMVEEVVETGNYDLAEEVLGEYKQEIIDVKEIIDSIEGVENREKLNNKVNEDIDLFVAVESEVNELKYDSGIPAVDVATVVVVEAELSENVVVPVAAVEEEDAEEIETISEGPYGIIIKGDKPLSPFLQDIE